MFAVKVHEEHLKCTGETATNPDQDDGFRISGAPANYDYDVTNCGDACRDDHHGCVYFQHEYGNTVNDCAFYKNCNNPESETPTSENDWLTYKGIWKMACGM